VLNNIIPASFDWVGVSRIQAGAYRDAYAYRFIRGENGTEITCLIGFAPCETRPFHLSFQRLCDTNQCEGPKKATRVGVNGSQSKFLAGTWPMSQNQPETPFF
jgi:hypothetical protein